MINNTVMNDNNMNIGPQGSSERSFQLIDLCLFVLICGCTLVLAQERLVARDEGFYAYAIELVRDGKIPYLDFFYPQMPFLPYCYSFFSFLFGSGWEAYRVFSGFLFGGIVFCTYAIISLQSSRMWGAIGALLVLLCHLSFAWFSVVQTYNLSVFLCLLSFLFLVNSSSACITGLLSGLLMGAAVATRLFFGPLAMLPLLLLLQKRKHAKLIGYCVGGVLASIPVFILLAIDHDVFWFNNMGYHMTRATRDFSGELQHKWRVFEVLFSLGRPSDKFDGIQCPFLFIGMFLSLGYFWHRSYVAFCAALFGATIFFISFLPSPTYVQYFSSVVPFSVIATVLGLERFLSARNLMMQRGIGALLLGCLGIYLWSVPTDILRYTQTGIGVIGVGGKQGALEWNVPRLREVQSVILEHTTDEERILSLWPGYLVGVERPVIPETENHFGLRTAEKLSESDRRKYKVKNIQELTALIAAREVELVVGYKRSLRGALRRALRDAHFQTIDAAGQVEFWKQGEKENIAPSE